MLPTNDGFSVFQREVRVTVVWRHLGDVGFQRVASCFPHLHGSVVRTTGWAGVSVTLLVYVQVRQPVVRHNEQVRWQEEEEKKVARHLLFL